MTWNYHKPSIIHLKVWQQCKPSSDVNANSRSKDSVDVSIEKYNDHPSINMINENASFESRFSF